MADEKQPAAVNLEQPPQEAKGKDKSHQAVHREMRVQSLLHAITRWVIVLLAAIIFGAVLVTLTLYNPTQQKLQDAEKQIVDLKAELGAQQEGQQSQACLAKELERVKQHEAILSAMSELKEARLELGLLDKNAAKLALQSASESMSVLALRLEGDQQKVVQDIRQTVVTAWSALDEMDGVLKTAPSAVDRPIATAINYLEQQEDMLFIQVAYPTCP
jgi:hypothetical protein